jgi:hypothetical protein
MSTFHRTWLQLWCTALIGLGAVFALAVVPALNGPVVLFTDLVFWPLDGRPTLDRASALALSIVGTVMIGWGLLMAALMRTDDLAADPRIWRAMTTAMTVWYVVDSAVSILGGAWLNAVSNTALYATYLWPVLASGVLGAQSPARTAR